MNKNHEQVTKLNKGVANITKGYFLGELILQVKLVKRF